MNEARVSPRISGPEETSMTPFYTAMSRARGAANTIEQSIDALEDRLDAFLQSTPPAANQTSEVRPNTGAQAVDEIHSHADNLHGLGDRLASLLQRLAI